MAATYQIGNYFINLAGEISEITAVDRKCKTVILRHPDGKEESITYSTLRKKYRAYEPEGDELEKDEEEVASDGTSYAQIMQDIIADAEAKAEKAEKKAKKRGKKKTFEELVAMLPASENLVFSRMKDNSVAVKCGKKRLFRFDTVGNEYKFVADRVDHLREIEGAVEHQKGGKSWVEICTNDVKNTASKIIKNALALGLYIL